MKKLLSLITILTVLVSCNKTDQIAPVTPLYNMNMCYEFTLDSASQKYIGWQQQIYVSKNNRLTDTSNWFSNGFNAKPHIKVKSCAYARNSPTSIFDYYIKVHVKATKLDSTIVDYWLIKYVIIPPVEVDQNNPTSFNTLP